MKARYMVGGLAVVALSATAAPVVGAPSLSKLVKKEVAKQIGKAQGPPGAQGPAGATGPSSAREVNAAGPVNLSSGTPITVGTMSAVSPGAYAVTAKVNVSDMGTDGLVRCSLITGTASEFDPNMAVAQIGSTAGHTTAATFNMTLSHTFASTGTLQIQCIGGTGLVASNATIVAIRLGSESTG